MASTRFTVLTGHLSQYSLADLIGILRHQRKTGRLLIEYIGCPAVLYFKDGDLVDAQYNTLTGVQAIFVSFVQPPAAFNFNPLMQPTRYSIDSEQQRVILELLGCWTEDFTVVRSATRSGKVTTHDAEVQELQAAAPLLIAPSSLDMGNAIQEADEVLALPAAPPQKLTRSNSRRRPLVLAVATFILLLVFGVPTLIAISNKVRKPATSPATPAANTTSIGPVAAPANGENTSAVTAKSGMSTQPTERKHEREMTTDDARREETSNQAAPVQAPAKEVAKTATVPEPATQPEKAKQQSTSGQTVKVIMRIENGRVVQATVGDRRPGSEAYESMALRIARNRRYPAGVTKQETLIMKVDGPK